MKNLLQVINNKKDHEGGKKKYFKPDRKHIITKNGREKRLAYKLAGLQFFLTRRQWAEYTGISYKYICRLVSYRWSNGQVLGYEERVHIKNRGRPKK